MSRDPGLETFLAESAELLTAMESVLLRCEQGAEDQEAINELFRAAHTLKGSSGLFGLDTIVAFTHVVESVLDRARTDRSPISASAAAILLECADHIGTLVGSIAAGGAADDPALLQSGLRILDRLTAETGYAGRPAASPSVPPAAGASAQQAIGPPLHARTEAWHVSVRFSENVLSNGMDPLSFIRYLSTFGSIDGLKVIDEGFPDLAHFDPECCYIGFEIDLATDAGKSRIEAAFEFVRDDCTLSVVPRQDAAPGRVPGEEQPPAAVADAALALIDAAPPQQAEARATKDKAAEGRSIRVDGDKLDRLIDWIGELIVAGATTGSLARGAGLPLLQESALQLEHIVGEIRDQALKLRMVQIGSTFSKFQRVVRDVAREIGKEISLEIVGAETELDRTLVEGIADPLTHLVRNAVDHGIETSAIRRSCGKPAVGVVRLNAYHDAGSVIIEVSDDGGGLKRERILQKATERGLIGAGDTLSDKQIYALIFEPGFSTAEQVTNLSGRGVGMDVVKRNITALRGSVEVFSEEGRGTRICIRLPLTLAIIDGFQVGVGRSHFVIPLDLVEECVEVVADESSESSGATGHISLHGAVLPLIRLRETFSIQQAKPRRQSIVVVRSAGMRVGIVVDELLGELQAVIKPLSKLFSQLQGIGGSTILGSGKVALILDVPSLIELTLARSSSADDERRARMRNRDAAISSLASST